LTERAFPASTVELEPQHGIDLARLRHYLQQAAPQLGALRAIRKFKGGQSNPTFWLDCETAAAVLRRKPPGVLLKSAHAVEREFRVIQALANTDVPVAPAHVLCEDDSVLGSPFYVMGYVAGRIFWDPSLPEVPAPARSAYYSEMARVLAAIHAVGPAAIGLGDYGRPGNYFARQIARWIEQYRQSELAPIDDMHTLIDWLPANIPPGDDECTLVHGDFRIDNMIFHPTEPKILAVVDWELSTLGHPLGDLSYACLTWRLPRVGPIKGLLGLDLSALALPSEADFKRDYCARSGRPAPEPWSFYMAFNLFRLAAIAQGVAKRASSGQASSRDAVQVGEMVPVVASAAVALITSTSVINR
jgi:aminoglycoside phosphotransferase (APT) family kinase protein